jgi:hypothetical protein
MHLCCCWQTFSLKKYCEIVSKDRDIFVQSQITINLGAGPLGLILPLCLTDESDKAIVADDANGAVLHSLTKYSAIFAEVKGYFGIIAPFNQLGQKSLCSLRSKSWYQLDNQLEIVIEKELV